MLEPSDNRGAVHPGNIRSRCLRSGDGACRVNDGRPWPVRRVCNFWIPVVLAGPQGPSPRRCQWRKNLRSLSLALAGSLSG